MFLSTFATHPFLVKPTFKPIFSLHQNVTFFQWTLFSHFSWQDISSIIWMEWWGGDPSRPQDPCSIFSHGDQGEFFFGFFCLEKCCFMLHWKFDGETLSFCCVILLEFGALYDWSCCNVGFGAFLKCCIFPFFFFFGHGVIWTILVAYGILGNVDNLWCCWMNFGLDFWGMDIVKILCCRLGWIYSWCMWEIFVGMSKFYGYEYG